MGNTEKVFALIAVYLMAAFSITCTGEENSSPVPEEPTCEEYVWVDMMDAYGDDASFKECIDNDEVLDE